MGIHRGPHTHPIAIPMGIPTGIPIPTAALVVILDLNKSRVAAVFETARRATENVKRTADGW